MREIRYRPKPLRETLVEVKDTSELAVDLAYSAVLFDSDEIAEEVLDLARRANYLRYHARIALMLAAKNVADAEAMVGIFQVVEGAVTVADAAVDIANVQLRDFGIPPEFRTLPDAHEQFVRVAVPEGSPLAGGTLCDLELDIDEGVTVLAVRRDDEWYFAPEGDFRLQARDVVFGRGPEEGVAEFHERATGDPCGPPESVDGDGVDRAVESIVELKNVSELAVGLSYSAVLYDSDDIAEEVREIEAHSDELRDELERWVVRASDDSGVDPEERRGLFRLAVAAEVISDAALGIADVVFRDVELHPVFGQAIRESRDVITSVTLAAESDLVGRTIDAFEHDVEAGMTALALRRGGTWTYDPSDETELRAGDTLVLRGPRRGEDLVRGLAGE